MPVWCGAGQAARSHQSCNPARSWMCCGARGYHPDRQGDQSSATGDLRENDPQKRNTAWASCFGPIIAQSSHPRGELNQRLTSRSSKRFSTKNPIRPSGNHRFRYCSRPVAKSNQVPSLSHSDERGRSHCSRQALLAIHSSPNGVRSAICCQTPTWCWYSSRSL